MNFSLQLSYDFLSRASKTFRLCRSLLPCSRTMSVTRTARLSACCASHSKRNEVRGGDDPLSPQYLCGKGRPMPRAIGRGVCCTAGLPCRSSRDRVLLTPLTRHQQAPAGSDGTTPESRRKTKSEGEYLGIIDDYKSLVESKDAFRKVS